jgi:N-acetylmuramoyl-L-alanine amidase
MVKKLKYLLVLAFVATVFLRFGVKVKGNNSEIRTIVIDPGHGGKDPGCLGSIHNEKGVALAVALKLGKLLEENLKDVKVIYTRTSDVFVELEDRAQIANKAKADLFISIHCNAAGKPVIIKDPKTGKKRAKTYRNKKGKLVVVEKPNPVPFGTETYVMGLKNEEGKMRVATRENSAIFYEEDYEKKYGGFDPESEESYIIMSNYTSAYVIQSASLAMKIQDEYVKKSGRIDKGVHRQSIWVLWRTSMPSILTELGYLTNPLEEAFLGSEKGQDYLAKSIFRGLRKYKDEVEGKKKVYDDEFEKQEAIENENVKAGNIPGQKNPFEEDGDDEIKVTEKEKLEKVDAIKNEPLKKVETKTVSTQPVKQKIDDDAFATIEVQGKDSSLGKTTDTDTMLTSKEIAARFTKEKEKKELNVPEPNTHPNAELPEVVFKVQFASTESPLNLKEDKFSSIIDGDFYKMSKVLKYTSGKFEFLKDAVNHQNLLRAKGFKDCFVVAFSGGNRINIVEAKKLAGQ